MSEPTVPPGTPQVPPISESPLQFERAEFSESTAGVVCAACSQPIPIEYYEVNGKVICRSCRDQVEASGSQGTSLTRFVRALAAGLVAAAAGAGLYFLVAKLTGYEFGLIAIVVGFAVGTAVRWGSYGRGGWRYQTLAIALTYFAIVSTNVPAIIEAIGKADVSTEAAADGGQSTASDSQPPVPDVQPVAVAATSPADTAEGASLGIALIGIVLLLVIAAAAPFLAGFENIIGLIIIGIGVYEAWKLNKRQVLTITGPHSVSRTPSPTVAS